MKNISIREIESAIAALAGTDREFTVPEVVGQLGCQSDDGLCERVERTLHSDGELFERDGKYLRRAAFFNGKQFAVTPDEAEIEGGILIPGHRFAPYCHADIFPSEIRLTVKGARKPLATKEFSSTLTEVFPRMMLLGSEQVSDYLVADHKANEALNKAVKNNQKVVLNVFDLSAFYQKNDFATGDALLCKIVDYDQGVFQCDFLSGTDRKESASKEYASRLGEAITTVVEQFENYLDLPEALRLAFFTGGDTLFGKTSGSLDEFLFFNEKIDIAFDNGETSFVRRHAEHGDGECECGCGHDHEDTDSGLPDGLSLSSGTTDSFAKLLQEVGANVSIEEIDGCILDCCYARELIFDDFFQRLFDRDKLNFADEAQEAVFFNCLEERWEDLTESYDRVGDESRADLRSRLLELADLRRNRFTELAELDAKLEKAPQPPFRKLAELAIYSNDLLRLLNAEGQELPTEQKERLSASLDQFEDIQNEAFETIFQALNL